ncbi:MAG: alpha/beta family hydrolase [Ilumatobacteraceae bacterium]
MRKPAGVVLFPGAGSAADHPSLVAMEGALSPLPVRRVDFPYRRAGRRAPDRAPVLVACVKEEVRAFARELGVPTSRIAVGGRSMGGRMCSMAVADTDDPLRVAALVLVSYPLHPPAQPEKKRTAHLPGVTVPVLCISGTRDTFGTTAELRRAFRRVAGEVTWVFVDGKGHDLRGCDESVAATVSDWLTKRRPRG